MRFRSFRLFSAGELFRWFRCVTVSAVSSLSFCAESPPPAVSSRTGSNAAGTEQFHSADGAPFPAHSAAGMESRYQSTGSIEFRIVSALECERIFRSLRRTGNSLPVSFRFTADCSKNAAACWWITASTHSETTSTAIDSGESVIDSTDEFIYADTEHWSGFPQ